MQPLVSVILPNYNHARFLEQRIDTILNQTYTDFELIILDDCSTDNSKEIIDLYTGNEKVAHIVYNEKNSGCLFKQWQKGLDLAKGEWIWIAESDDYCTPSFLKTMMSKASEGVSVVFCKSNIVDENGEIMSNSTVWQSDLVGHRLDNDFVVDGKDLFYEIHAYKNIVSNTSSVVFRKEIVGKIAFPYNPDNSSIEDYIHQKLREAPKSGTSIMILPLTKENLSKIEDIATKAAKQGTSIVDLSTLFNSK